MGNRSRSRKYSERCVEEDRGHCNRLFKISKAEASSKRPVAPSSKFTYYDSCSTQTVSDQIGEHDPRKCTYLQRKYTISRETQTLSNRSDERLRTHPEITHPTRD